jgi:hypothetical protein
MSASQAPGEPIQPAQLTLNGRVLDRRSFIGALSLTAAGSLLVGRGWTAAAATHGGIRLSQPTAGEVGGWHVDDMWGHMPRYAHPIPYPSTHATLNWENVDPIDRNFIS